MKWPWRKDPENRGTITFVNDHLLVIGVPHGTDEETAYNIARSMEEWQKDPQPLVVFPWPVDVVDKR